MIFVKQYLERGRGATEYVSCVESEKRKLYTRVKKYICTSLLNHIQVTD